MKAVKFVKKFGWGVAIDEYINARNRGCYLNGKYSVLIHQPTTPLITENVDFVFSVEELKRLVESYELVESYGGLDELKQSMPQIMYMLFGLTEDRTVVRLKQAIADVESCL